MLQSPNLTREEESISEKTAPLPLLLKLSASRKALDAKPSLRDETPASNRPAGYGMTWPVKDSHMTQPDEPLLLYIPHDIQH